MQETLDGVIHAIKNRTIGSYRTRRAYTYYHKNPDTVETEDEELCRYMQLIRKYPYQKMRALLDRRLIVSLTSYPGRIEIVAEALKTLFFQTMPADMIVLWLAGEEFPAGQDDLPEVLVHMIRAGRMEIRWCENLKPHKKYVYALKEFNNDLVITVDDDLYYCETLIESVFLSYLEYPDAISACRLHWIGFDEKGHFASYNQWEKEVSVLHRPSMRLFSTNGAGTLFPPGLIKEELLDSDLLMSLCPIADDLWVKTIATICDIPVVQAMPYRKLAYIPDTQQDALWQKNKSQNDIQLAKIKAWADQRYGTDYLEKKILSFEPDRSVEQLKTE